MSRKTRWPARSGPWLASAGIALSLFLNGASLLIAREPRNRHEASHEKGNARPVDLLAGVDVSDFDRLLHTYVSDEGWVDYGHLVQERGALNRLLASIGEASPSKFESDHARLAFWINTYNAMTLADVLDTTYGKHKSVREVAGFFVRRRHLVAGEQLTLDEIEKRGRDLHDPRIHFSIVCASASCPKLQRFAYTTEKLDGQLDQVAREFLEDPNRGLRFDVKSNDLYVSPILKWYAGDFTGTSGGAGTFWARAKATVSGSELLDFVARYAPPEVAHRIQEKPPTLHYFEYDWSLNSLDTHAPGDKR
jgi:hypothetical protein